MDVLNKIPKKNEELTWRVIDNEAVVIPLEEQSEEGEKFDIFNQTATRIWELIDGKLAVKDIIRKITDEYDIEAEEAELQVNKFLNHLSKKKLINI